uniref:Leucine-rich repeat-containing N-terminal plant-type domain-containing protein n=3 Tax=Aegilops tauschii TaxID=37682 RepID=A0A453G5R8_AEGTS
YVSVEFTRAKTFYFRHYDFVKRHLCKGDTGRQLPGSAMHGYTRLVVWLLLLSSSSPCFGHVTSDSDVQCLKDLKQSVIDPNGVLEASWSFSNNGIDGYICRFTGVECWHPDQNRVLGLRLGNLGLEGLFPPGLHLCSFMTALDMSGNNFSGPLPEHIFEQMGYMTYLDLSNNSFSGVIPAGIGNMTYLSTLALQHNQFAGGIPAQLGNTSQLISFNVADNSLSGPVLDSLQRFPATNFTANPGLCGPPLDKRCKKRFRVRIHVRLVRTREMFVRIQKLLHRINDASIIGALAGFIFGFMVAFYFPHKFLFCGRL